MRQLLSAVRWKETSDWNSRLEALPLEESPVFDQEPDWDGLWIDVGGEG